MKRIPALPSFLLVAAFAASAVAQAPRPPVVSPEVGTDRRVTFRFQAAKAGEVSLNGQWPEGKAPMAKDTNGVWSVTVGPVPAGVWEYAFQVDGVGLLDPLNPALKPMRNPRTSILHLPAAPPAAYDFQDVPHGVVHQHAYRSKALGRLRELAVYTPPGYDAKSSGKYPTLYLQHGSGDNQATWTAHGKAHWILDNLIAAGRAKPMVVVMMDGHAALPGMTNNTAAFEQDLFGDVLPFVESAYRVRRDAKSRAIVGLSMGGGQALTLGLNHSDTFAWVGGFSSAPPSRESVSRALDDSTGTNRRLKLLWIACGEKDFLLHRNREFLATLDDRKIRHEWVLTPGDHSWPVWRGYLADITPRLFR